MVTGASGFIGSHLVRGLAARGFLVVAQYRSGSPPFPSLSAVRCWQADLNVSEPCPFPVDCLVHAAATSPDPTVPGSDSKAEMFAGNVKAAWEVAQRSLALRISRRVYLSSFSAEKISVGVASGQINTDFYGLSKFLGEKFFARTHRAGGSTLVVRLPAVVGRGAVRNWPAQVVGQIRRGLPVKIFSPNTLFNSVVGIEELVAWICDWLKKPRRGYYLCGLGCSSPVTIREAVRILGIASCRVVKLRVLSNGKKAGSLRSFRQARKLGFCPASTTYTLTRYAQQALA